MTIEEVEQMLHKAKVGVLAHAIRLGKCPEPGLIASAKVDLKTSVDGEITDSKSFDKRLEFEVTSGLIEEAKQMINSQEAEYREPKTTTVQIKVKGEGACGG
jgi:hypothetical protein